MIAARTTAHVDYSGNRTRRRLSLVKRPTSPTERERTIAMSPAAQSRSTGTIPPRLLLAAGVLFGAFFMGIGTTWDISWHTIVGRDSFWIPPHMVIYGGTIVTIAALATAWLREWDAVRRADHSPHGAIVGGQISRGLLVSSAGALWFLASGPFDDLWHRIYGLDVTLWSPPHVSLMAAGWTLVLGTTMLIVDERRRLDRLSPDRSARRRVLEFGLLVVSLGFLLQSAILAISPGIRFSYLQPGPLGAWLLPVLIAGLTPVILLAAPTVLAARAGAIVPVLVQVMLRPIGDGFAAAGYALAFPNGAPNGDSMAMISPGSAMVALTIVPLLLLVPAALADITLLAARRYSPGRSLILAAMAFGLGVVIVGAIGPVLVRLEPRPTMEAIAIAPALLLISLMTALVGSKLARVLVGSR